MSPRALLVVAGVSGALAVALGAFGAHALAEEVSPDRLATWRTASQYHLLHSLAMGLCAMASRVGWNAGVSGILFLVGTVGFSGSLYLLVLLDLPVLGAIAPVGGLAFIAGWAVLSWTAWREQPTS